MKKLKWKLNEIKLIEKEVLNIRRGEVTLYKSIKYLHLRMSYRTWESIRQKVKRELKIFL